MADAKPTPQLVRSATFVQRIERGRQARNMASAPPFTPTQRRQLEDALSSALLAAMGVESSIERVSFLARHLAAQDHGRQPEEPPTKVAKLSDQQRAELADLSKAVTKAVNACNGKAGSALRNVAQHLLGQYRTLKNPSAVPMTAKDRARAARMLAMKSTAEAAPQMEFTKPAAPTEEEEAAHEAMLAEEEASDPLVIEAKKTAAEAFESFDKAGNGEISADQLFDIMLKLGRVPGATLKDKNAYLSKTLLAVQREFEKADTDNSGAVDFKEFVAFYVECVQQDEAENAARKAFAKVDVDGGNSLDKIELFQVLLDLGCVVGDTKAEKEAYLEREFAEADVRALSQPPPSVLLCRAPSSAHPSRMRHHRRRRCYPRS